MLLLNKYLKTSKQLAVVCLFLLKYPLVGQNLISNPSFERVDTPVYWNSGDFINSSIFPPKRNVTNWDWFNSPDYFSSNVPYTGVFRGVPINDFGSIYPKHGNAYGGVIAYTRAGEYKEYISQQLISPLIADSVYCLSFFASKADNIPYSIKNIGSYLSVNSPTLFSNTYIIGLPQVVSITYVIDTINWTEIKGCFTALGGEKYITIGNFNSNANTDTLFVGTTSQLSGANGYAYYYIDSVSLWKNSFPTFIKEEKKNEFVSVYPNPSSGKIKLTSQNLKDIEHCMIKITDVLFREVIQLKFEEEIDISELEKGIYFLSLYKGSQLIVTKKIIKE